MSYLTKDEKKEYKDAKKFLGGESAKFIIILIILTFVFGGIGVGYKLTVGKANINADREIFEHNKSHVHSMIEDLSKYKLELARTEDKTERKAIINFITENYATFDSNLIENKTLKSFLNDVMEGRIN